MQSLSHPHAHSSPRDDLPFIEAPMTAHLQPVPLHDGGFEKARRRIGAVLEQLALAPIHHRDRITQQCYVFISELAAAGRAKGPSTILGLTYPLAEGTRDAFASACCKPLKPHRQPDRSPTC